MSVVNEVTAAPKAAVSFAKAKPLAFAFVALVIVLLAIRFSSKIGAFLVKLPVVGKVFAKILTPSAPTK